MTDQEPRIFSRKEHCISRNQIDPDALKVLYGLSNQGFTSYMVGGSVRDLLLEKAPKDFDVATNARPRQVKKIFKNCWLIGRRFRLAHVKFGSDPENIIEVATFRAPTPETTEGDGVEMLAEDNTFGTPEEDALRRDFTINALFYNIKDFSVIDYVGGVEDIRNKVLRSIGDARVRYVEDPVRMLRALRYSRRLGFSIAEEDVAALKEHASLLFEVPYSRLTEELHKMFATGQSESIFEGLKQFDLVKPMCKGLDKMLENDNVYTVLRQLDALVEDPIPPGKPELWATLIDECWESLDCEFKGPIDLRNQARIHVALEGLNVSKRDREICCQLLTTLTQMKGERPIREQLLRRSYFPIALRIYRLRVERNPEEEGNFQRWYEAGKRHEVTEIKALPTMPRRRKRRRRSRYKKKPGDSY